MESLIKRYIEFVKEIDSSLLIIDEFTYDSTLSILKEVLSEYKHGAVGNFHFFNNDVKNIKFISGEVKEHFLCGLSPKYIIAKIKPKSFQMIMPMLQRYKDSKYTLTIIKE